MPAVRFGSTDYERLRELQRLFVLEIVQYKQHGQRTAKEEKRAVE
jgi:hypothetical protein